ncbi:MAG: ABC transporter permease subunit [Halobacteriales archaeon]|nr:ABC transporter permease subunit [Halobacteriales archaeon]
MRWLVVARREGRDVARSRALRALVALFVLVGIAAVAVPATAFDGRLPADRALAFLVAPLKLVVGLAGLLAGQGAIAAPRTGGQLKLTLGLPIPRTALVLGAFLGRAVVVLAGTAAGLLAVAMALVVVHGTLPTALLGEFAALLGLFAVTATAVGVGLSAASPTRGVAAAAALGAFVLFQFFWGVVPGGVHYAIEGSLPGTVVPPWVVLLERLQPFAAFEAAAEHLLPAAGGAVRLSGEGAAATGSGPSSARLAGDPPAYLGLWAAVATLAGWAVGALAIGAARFARADL